MIATFTDLRERIVPDKLTYSLIGGGLLLQLAFAVMENSVHSFLTVAAVTIATFLGACFFWKIGVWAGGDVKLFTAIAVLNPINYGVLRDFLGLSLPEFGSISLPIFPLTLFVFSIFSMVPLAIIITINGIAKNKALKKKLFYDLKSKIAGIIVSALLVSGAIPVFSYFNINQFFIALLLIAASFSGKKIFTAAGSLIFAAGIFFGGLTVAQHFGLLFFGFFSFYFFIKLYFLAKSNVLIEKIRTLDLEEGMISAKLIVKEKGKIKVGKALTIKSVIKHLRNNNVEGLIGLMRPKGKILASPTNAGGLEKEQIKEIKKAAKKGELKDFFEVKKSVPFVPAVLIAYLITQVFGDFLWQVIF